MYGKILTRREATLKAGILTMFNGLDKTYSLVNVVAEHLNMLLAAGIQTKLLVSEDCSDHERTGIYADNRIEWVKIKNHLQKRQIKWYDYSQPDGVLHDSFFQEADVISKDYVENLFDVDVCILHDIHYQGWHLVHNIALRKAQEKLPQVRFLAFTHSLPVNPPPQLKWPFSARYTAMPRTVYVYPSSSGIPALARQFNIPEGKCRIVNNSFDITADMSKDIQNLCCKNDLLSPDILIVYPARLTPGKQFEKLAAFAGAIKKRTELHIKVVFCDFPSMDIDPVKYKQEIQSAGNSFGLNEGDLCFTSDLGYPAGFPHSSVLELFTLSNLFVCPSYSESFGLTVLEAAGRGNFIVLNQAVPALEELGKMLQAYYMRWNARNFGFDSREIYHPSEQAYLEEHAEKVVALMRENPVVHAKTLVRRRFSPQWIWRNQFEPLLGNEK